MRTISNASLRRQIAREGKRWGLVPTTEDGKVMAAQKETVWVQTAPGVLGTRRELRAVCSIDMHHPFANVLRMRWRRWQHNKARIIREANARREADARRPLEDKRHSYLGDLHRATRQLGNDQFISALLEVTRGSNNAR